SHESRNNLGPRRTPTDDDLMLTRRALPLPPGPLLGLLGLALLFAGLLALRGEVDNFVSLSNLQVLLHKSSVPGVLALGALLVILSGGIDLSVGSVVALSAVLAVQAYRLVHDGPEVVLRQTDLLEWLQEKGWAWQPTHSAGWATFAAVTAGLFAGGLCG